MRYRCLRNAQASIFETHVDRQLGSIFLMTCIKISVSILFEVSTRAHHVIERKSRFVLFPLLHVEGNWRIRYARLRFLFSLNAKHEFYAYVRTYLCRR